jgi:hypothetical protein
MRALLLAAALVPALVFGAPEITQAQTTSVASAPAASAYERDRQAILSQIGDFRVRFDMRETIALVPGYTPLDAKTSGGHEIVRVVYDEGDRISLQHILVMEHGGQTHVIKHWRQDWVYQPETVLTYAGPDQWALTPVAAGDRSGAWSQTVWQTDDSPRYGGVGHWTYDNGMAVWTSNQTWRPLARRDAVRSPVYDRYVGANRHVLMPDGWAHLQDNLKLGQSEGSDGELTAYVQEDVVNTYRRFDGFDPSAGDAYWAATQDYWAVVRDAWDAAIAAGNGVYIEEEAQFGSVVSAQLMTWADEIQAGDLTTEAASEQARALIAQATVRPAA